MTPLTDERLAEMRNRFLRRNNSGAAWDEFAAFSNRDVGDLLAHAEAMGAEVKRLRAAASRDNANRLLQRYRYLCERCGGYGEEKDWLGMGTESVGPCEPCGGEGYLGETAEVLKLREAAAERDELRKLLKECEGLLVQHHSCAITRGLAGDVCKVCGGTDIFRRIAEATGDTGDDADLRMRRGDEE